MSDEPIVQSEDSKITVYAIVKANGEIKRRRGGQGNLAIYTRERIAKNHAVDPGDSVVEAVIDLWREPLFIRAQKIPGGVGGGA